jgi:catalase (peroxidase I)
LKQPYQILPTEDEDIYFFCTDLGIEYIIQMFDYSWQLPEPISGRLFTFNFYRKNEKVIGEKHDPRIKDTVVKFLSDFFLKNDNCVITICETIDKKELARHKLFHKWFEGLEIENVKKFDREIELEDYLIPTSLFIHNKNPEREYILSFFETMSFN